MNIAVDELAISVFKKPLTECSVTEVKQLAQQFPWFGPAQLLYAKKLQSGNATIYEDQVQKTSLYFQNRLWLDHLLNENGYSGIIAPDQPLEEEHRKEIAPVTLPEREIPETASAIQTTEDRQLTEDAIEEPTVASGTAEVNEPKAVIDHLAPAEGLQVADDSIEEPLPAAEIPEISGPPVKIAHEAPTDEGATPFTPGHSPEPEPSPTVAGGEEAPLQDSKEPALELPHLKFETIKNINAPLTFEPYHTIDYFASQGIKFKEEEKPKDQFGQQLKSFTEWLKTMKRVSASEIATAAVTSSEKKVEQLAEHSLAERHVITEAMAEVWKKQGNLARAEEIYRKLSLLDPPKSAYFASKIEELKKTS